jgi:prepilin-type N-terminal cleavage/methylation domain-containing protein
MSRHRDLSERGFSLIEILVALLIVTIIIAAIGPFARDTLLRVAAMSDRLPTGRALLTAMVVQGRTHALDGFANEAVTGNAVVAVTARPFGISPTSVDVQTLWRPMLVNITVTTESGLKRSIETIRLERP